MSLFLGEYNPNITAGSRIVLPKKHRDEIKGDVVILSKGFEGCIFVFGKEDWVDLVQNRIEKRRGDANLEEFERYIYPSAVEVSIDLQGRIVIPSNLLDFAGVNKEASVIGVGDHVEIWNRGTWVEYRDRVLEKWRKNA